MYVTKSKLKPFFDTKKTWPGGFDENAEKNAYDVFGELFVQLDREEENEEMVGQKHVTAPIFGGPAATMDEVFAFYEHWLAFTSIKPFAYADVYNPAEAPNRRVKRLIEIENNRERKKERQDFIAMVRQLVEKLKARDPRFIKY